MARPVASSCARKVALAETHDAGFAAAPLLLWHVLGRRRGRKVFVELVHDIASGDPEPVLREGREDIEQIKRDTTAGSGVGPGRSLTG